MRVLAHPDRCVGAGQCVLTAPVVFDQGPDDGLVALRTTAPPATELDAVR
ncbi:ferredoxin [Actinoalloteichus hymeniacidonis]|uniref:Divergent 4Fe-4S mono-cluster n=1 Tax=Actinoalloteichus hymeniacidonis TaxID=340345 RepID=A0AAC9MXU7_9PSEU|nr:Divergent 4Fe-4S mono-cluster [Actinoalloteichus hymeniacidonis]MBB5908244.1 ferredoxin [Actinoalloteichus hymeniacidonis]